MTKKEETKTLWAVGGILILIIAGSVFLAMREGKPGALDDFAKCLKEKGAVFYGAFWCSHCQNQKKLFGSSEKYLPYVECSTPDGGGQLSLCNEKKIDGYPTWEFSDGSRESGELSLERLSEKTSCELPTT